MNRKPQNVGAAPSVDKGAVPAKRVSPLAPVWRVLGAIGRTIATFVMVTIITGCIVACVVAVYILQMIANEEPISLSAVRMGYTSLILAEDSEGEEVVLARLHFGGQDRTWVDLENISPHVINAAVAIEDRRFWEHGGVDWRRTAGAAIGMFAQIEGTITGGGSTITQQLVKNVTGDDDFRVDRKLQEIFRSLELSTHYSREDIMEAYLNLIHFGNGTNGIQAAANFYFGVDASELTIAQSAALVGITQFPGRFNPYVNPEAHRYRMLHVLWEMHEQEMITTAEYERAINERLNLRNHDTGLGAPIAETSYFVDHVINDVIAFFIEDARREGREITRGQAHARLMSGGYRVYTTVDLEMQAFLEDFFLTTEEFPPVITRGNEYPQSATVVLDPQGRVLATVGGIGEKHGQLTFNRATMSRRHPGSAIKPIGPFALGIEQGTITWSTIIEDSPVIIHPDGRPWPINHYPGFRGPMTVTYAMQLSVNTVAVKITERLGPNNVFNFLYDDLHFAALVRHEVRGDRVYSDIDLSPLSLGAFTHGVSPLEMAAAYNIFANGGWYYRPYSFTRIERADGEPVFEWDPADVRSRAVSEETSVVMRRMLERVVTDPPGTGRNAQLAGGMPTAGKTGTSQYNTNQWFVGFTPYYMAPAWLGFDRTTRFIVDENGRRHEVPNRIDFGGAVGYPPPVLWRNMMQPLHEGLEVIPFPDSPNVVSFTYCRISGDLATTYCAATGSGWYKTSRVPGQCITCRFGLGSSGDGEEDDGLEAYFGNILPGAGGNANVPPAVPDAGGSLDYVGAGTDIY